MTYNPRHPGANRRGGAVAKVVVSIVMLAAVGLVVAVAILPAPGRDEPVQSVRPVNVRVAPVVPIPEMPDAFVLPGTVEPNSVVRVSAEVAGRIEAVECVEGRTCRADDVIVRLNTDLLQAEMDRAKARMEFDAREQERIDALRDRGVATDTEYDQAKTQAAASQAAFDAAKAQLDRATILAPTAGVLNRLPVERGEYVVPGTVVAEIVDVDRVLAVVDVPERDIRFLKVGQAAAIHDRDLDGHVVNGTITYISELAEAASRTTRVEITVDNTPRILRSGQIVDVRLTRRTLTDVILVPLEAVVPLENGYRAYVVENGKSQPRPIELGGFRGREVFVRSGLRAGEKLIVAGQYYVGPGQPVVVQRGPATAPGTQRATQPAGAGAGREARP